MILVVKEAFGGRDGRLWQCIDRTCSLYNERMGFVLIEKFAVKIFGLELCVLGCCDWGRKSSSKNS